MKRKTKHNLKITNLLAISVMLFLIAANTSQAMTPEFVSGLLFLKADNDMSRTYTGYWSIICGVGTWYYKYETFIKNYCWNYKGRRYYATLPWYGFTRVTSEKLANLITVDGSLALWYISPEVFNKIKKALDDDRSAASYPKNLNDYWDPYYDWKWRSVYMENRNAENGRTTPIMANCWGTADYLTRSFEWADAYPSSKQRALNYGISEWGASFPHIYLDGEPSDQYSIDRDLIDNYWRFPLKASGEANSNLQINTYLNSFDVIRMSSLVGTANLILNGINLGTNKHCAVYLCTDAQNRHWFFEKGNYGATSNAPYGIRAFGMDPYWSYENKYRSLFQHYDNYKLNLPDSYDENWAGITP